MSAARRDLFNPTWEKSSAARAILDAAIAEHDPSHVFGLLSGGHDSLCAVHIAAQHPRFSGVVSIVAAAGSKRTRRYVRETCKRQGWPLRVMRPLKGERYHEIVEEYGFPGNGQHSIIYRRLKERAVDRLIRESKLHWNDRIALVTGIRAQESKRRMGRTEMYHRIDNQVWIAPIIDWDAFDKGDYMAEHGLPPNEIVQLLHRSGECNCGCFGSPAELEELRMWCPEAAAEIDRLAARTSERFSWKWGESPPPNAFPSDTNQIDLPLCTSCVSRAPERAEGTGQ